MAINKIGIFGGTFDPIHNGHINIANDSLNKFNLDYLFFVPAGIAYHKKLNNITASDIRFKMCELCCTLNSKFKVSNIDINRNYNTYTYDTITEFKQMYPKAELWLLIGSDSLENLHKWYKFKEIQKLTNFIIAKRNSFNLNKLNKQTLHLLNTGINTPQINKIGKYRFLNSPLYNISSNEIRNMVKSKKNIHNFVPHVITDYIYNNKLYW